MFSFLHGIQGSSHFCATTSQTASVLLNRKLLTATSFGEPAAVRNKATSRISSCLLSLPPHKWKDKCLLNFLLLSSTFLESSGSKILKIFVLLRLFFVLVSHGAQQPLGDKGFPTPLLPSVSLFQLPLVYSTGPLQIWLSALAVWFNII